MNITPLLPTSSEPLLRQGLSRQGFVLRQLAGCGLSSARDQPSFTPRLPSRSSACPGKVSPDRPEGQRSVPPRPQVLVCRSLWPHFAQYESMDVLGAARRVSTPAIAVPQLPLKVTDQPCYVTCSKMEPESNLVKWCEHLSVGLCEHDRESLRRNRFATKAAGTFLPPANNLHPVSIAVRLPGLSLTPSNQGCIVIGCGRCQTCRRRSTL